MKALGSQVTEIVNGTVNDLIILNLRYYSDIINKKDSNWMP